MSPQKRVPGSGTANIYDNPTFQALGAANLITMYCTAILRAALKEKGEDRKGS